MNFHASWGLEHWLFVGLLGLILLSQATALVALIRNKTTTDRGSAVVVVGAWYLVILAAGLEAWRHPGWLPDGRAIAYAGLAVFLTGSWLRSVAVSTLDKHFSPLVELQEEHQLVTHGIYAWVRHPAYLGSLCWTLSVPLLLSSGAGLAVMGLVYIPALMYRIRVEEAMLAGHFGPQWESYRTRVRGLVPLPPRDPEMP